MKMKINKCLILLFVMYSCSLKQDGGSSAELSDKSNSPDWNCYSEDTFDICVPTAWVEEEQDSFEAFYYINKTDKSSFFVVAQFDLNELGISVKDYFKEVYRQLIIDKEEFFKKYSFKEISLETKQVYYGEYITEIGGLEYLSYSLYVPFKGRLIDITLKGRIDQRPELFSAFQNILFNFRMDGEILFAFNKEVKSTRFIDLEKW